MVKREVQRSSNCHRALDWPRQPLVIGCPDQGPEAPAGKTLLVVLAHSWDQVDRGMDLPACIDAVEAITRQENYQQLVWLRHWKDPEHLPLPESWIKACNGHRSNLWFLDAMRTLLELSDGLASNTFGTHLGYGAALGCQLHWIDVKAEQELSNQSTNKAQEEEEEEWSERERLSNDLRKVLTR